MSITKTGDWGKARSALIRGPLALKIAAKRAVMQEAQFFRTKIVQGLREQAPGGKRFKPLKPTTIAMRRFFGFKGSKALIRSGNLRNSVQVLSTGGTVFIGIARNARTKDGKDLVSIAALHEFGSKPIVQRMTDKQRKLLHAAFRAAGLPRSDGGGGGGRGIIVMRIPKRPFIQPVFDKYGKRQLIESRMRIRLAKMLLGTLAGGLG